jgi:hypothetical protein
MANIAGKFATSAVATSRNGDGWPQKYYSGEEKNNLEKCCEKAYKEG